MVARSGTSGAARGENHQEQEPPHLAGGAGGGDTESGNGTTQRQRRRRRGGGFPQEPQTKVSKRLKRESDEKNTWTPVATGAAGTGATTIISFAPAQAKF